MVPWVRVGVRVRVVPRHRCVDVLCDEVVAVLPRDDGGSVPHVLLVAHAVRRRGAPLHEKARQGQVALRASKQVSK